MKQYSIYKQKKKIGNHQTMQDKYRKKQTLETDK